jgi:PAS domain S-box-containing protein
VAYVRLQPGDAALLSAAFAQVPRGMVVLDRDLRYVAINETLAASNNLPLESHVGLTVAEAIPDAWPQLQPLFERALAGEQVVHTWEDVWVEHIGDKRSARVTFAPVRLPDDAGTPQVVAVAVIFEDVSEEISQRRRADRLRDLGVSLSNARTVADVAGATRDLCAEELGATTLLICTYDRSVEELETVGAGVDPTVVARYLRVPVDFDSPASEVFTTGHELVLRSRAEHDARWPTGADSAAANRVEASVTLPLVVKEQAIGVLGVAWDAPRDPSAEELSYLRALAVRVAGVVGRIVALDREEQSTARESALLRVAARLNGLHDEKQVATVIAHTVVDLTGAGEAGLHLLEPDGRGIVRIDEGDAIDPVRRQKYDVLPVDDTTPVGWSVASGQACWLDTPQAWDRFPRLRDDIVAMGWPSVAVVPLVVGDEGEQQASPFGAIYAHYKGPRRLLDHDRRFLGTVAELAASTLERLRVDAAEQRARRDLETSERRLARLSESGALGVGEGTDTHITSANRALLDMLGYDELPPGGIDWRGLTPPEWEQADAQAVDDLMTSGRATFEKEYFRADGSRLPVLLTIGTYSVTPLRTMFTVSDLRERRELERRERQSLLERDRLSRAVQAALFPTLRLEHSAWQVRVGYRPGDDRMALGGDFYDVLSRSDGRVCAVIGDVTGHGPAAAATGSALRAAWRTLLMGDEPLLTLPARLGEVLVSEREDDLFLASLLTVLLHPDGRVDTLCLGHPAPVVLRHDGVTPLPVRHDMILGAPVLGEAAVCTTTLEPDDRLMLYTDGLLESRQASDHGERFGLDDLVEVLDGLGHEVGPDVVIDAVAERHGEGLADDAAVVIIGPRSA